MASISTWLDDNGPARSPRDGHQANWNQLRRRLPLILLFSCVVVVALVVQSFHTSHQQRPPNPTATAAAVAAHEQRRQQRKLQSQSQGAILGVDFTSFFNRHSETNVPENIETRPADFGTFDFGDPSDLDVPNPSDVDLPNPSDVDLPNPSDIDLPNPSDIDLPNPSDFDFPNLPDLDIPNPSDINIPDISDFDVPNPSDSGIPSISDLGFPFDFSMPSNSDVSTLDDIPAESRSSDFTFLSFLSRPFTPFWEKVIPFYRPRQYDLQPITSFLLYFVCTDISGEFCNEDNTIKFTTEVDPPPNGFRYQDSGPESLQGVFWTRVTTISDSLALIADQFETVRSELVSFAPTRHIDGVQTGVLQTDENGYEYVFRVLGDHTWSASQNAPDTYASGADILYLFDLVEGTLDNPLRFVITPSLKLWYNCLRFNFGELTQLVSKFEQILITDPTDPLSLLYPGSKLWIRRNTILGFIRLDYLIIQVVDGAGNKIFPAWAEYADFSPITQFPGLVPELVNDRLQC